MLLIRGASSWTTAAPSVAITGGGALMSVDLFRATIANALVEDISDLLVDGAVDLNVDRAVKLAATFTLRSPARVNPYGDYLAPFLRLEYDNGAPTLYRQLGLYATEVPPGTATVEDATATFNGSDLTAVLATSCFADAYNIAAGTNVAAAVLAILAGAGITRTNIPATARTLAAAESFTPGSSRLTAANRLLTAIGWYELGTDLDGRVSTPGATRELTAMQPFAAVTPADLLAPVAVQPTAGGIVNVVIAVNDNPNAPLLKSIARNDDPGSPTSTVSVGREISPPAPAKLTGTVTQADLDAYSARLLAEGRSYYRVAKVKLAPNPDALIAHQTIDMGLTGEMAALSGRWWVRTAKIGFQPATAPVEIECNQTTDAGLGRRI